MKKFPFSALANSTATSLKGTGVLVLGPTNILGEVLFLVLDGMVEAKRL